MTEQTPTPEQIAAQALMDAAADWAADPAAVGENDRDARNWLRDRAAALTEPRIDLPEPTQSEVDAYTHAWKAESQAIGRGVAPAGQKTRAGLRAAFAVRAERLHVTTDDVIAVFDLYGDTYDLETVHDLADLANGVGR